MKTVEMIQMNSLNNSLHRYCMNQHIIKILSNLYLLCTICTLELETCYTSCLISSTALVKINMVGNQMNLDVAYSNDSSQLPHEDISIIGRVSGNQCQILFIK